MKVALVHDYLREYGGAERVVEVMHEIWPEAPLFTSFVDWNALGENARRFSGWDIRTSWVQRNPIVKRFHSPLRFLAPMIWDSFDLTGYDVVLTSSGWYMCRGVHADRNALHICYIHHPPRNMYGYATGSTLERYKAVRVYAAVVNFFLRHYDFRTAQQVDYFVANSKETARRVKKFYRRESTVIYPPVATQSAGNERTLPKTKKKDFYLSVSRLTYAKRVDLAIQACNELRVPLKIVGVGPETEALKTLAGPTVEFLGGVSDEELASLYGDSKALIFCALDEDFGMVPVEAMAHGTPVIALSQGGVRETVSDGKTGVFFDIPDQLGLANAIRRFERLRQDWSKACRSQALKFGKERFKRELSAFVGSMYRRKQGRDAPMI